MAKEIKIDISGGDAVENELVGGMVQAYLFRDGFEKVTLVDSSGHNDAQVNNDVFTVFDAVDRLRPNLFKATVVVNAQTDGFPHQPVIIDEHGRERYKTNEVVRYLLDEGPFDMNHLARIPFPLEDRQQFAQLIGYSVDGYDTLSYSPFALRAEAAERARDEVERIKNHGAAPMSHTAVVARDYDPVDDKTFAVEVEQPGTDNTSV